MQKLRVNPLLSTDSYKLSHWFQYPSDTETVYSHLVSRGGLWDKTLFFGLQYTLKAYLQGNVFTKDDIDEARAFSALHFGTDEVFNTGGWTRLLEKHGGKFPLKIRAVAEGSLVSTKNALMTIENTDPEFPWLTNWAETILLRGTWYPTTVATLSWHIKQELGKELVRTGSPDLLSYKLHDFGARGANSQESAAIGGAAHLVNFMGTDTMEAIALLKQYYGADKDMPGHSIAAMEHSTVTSWGRWNEACAYENMLDKSPTFLTACVVDSYDARNAVDQIFGVQLKDKILNRPGVVVLRPDSGDPVVVLEDIFNSVANRFGYEVNKKGYKVLPSKIRVIQGDGVNYQSILRINAQLTQAGWSMDNWGYGMGGALLQGCTRDTMQFAIKCSAINHAGTWFDVFKNPKTDASKASMGGRFCLYETEGGFRTVNGTDATCPENALQTVFLDGEIKQEYTLSDIRSVASRYNEY